jgi:GAF domain-containing protein
MSSDELQDSLESLFSGPVPETGLPAPVTDRPTPASEEPGPPAALDTAGLFSWAVEGLPGEGPVEPDQPVPRERLTPPSVEPSALVPAAQEPEPDSLADRAMPLFSDRVLAADDRDGAGTALSWGRERILNYLLGAWAIAGGIAVLALVVPAMHDVGRLLEHLTFLIAYVLIVSTFALRRVSLRWRVSVLIGAAYAVAISRLLQHGMVGMGPWYLISVPSLLFVLVSERSGIIAGVVNVVVYVVLALALRWHWLPEPWAFELGDDISQFVVFGVSFSLVTAITTIAQQWLSRTRRQADQSLEEQRTALRAVQAVSAQRGQDLERADVLREQQAQYLELWIQMGRIAAMDLGVEDLASRTAALLCEHPEVHYAGVFLLDRDRAYASLAASAGMERQAFLLRQQRLLISDHLLLSQCVRSGQARISMGMDEVQRGLDQGRTGLFVVDNMRSAVALPLIARGEVFGVLTVQSQSPAAFGNQDVVSLRCISDQAAAAISNAQMSEELRARSEEMEALQRTHVREDWEDLLTPRVDRLYEYDRPGIDALGGQLQSELDRVLAEPRVTVLGQEDPSSPSALVSPISLREQVLGVLGLHRVESDEPWTEDQIALIGALSEQMGLIIENSRLFADAQARAVRERQTREITARMRQSLDLETVLRTAALEVGEALHLNDVTIRLSERREFTGEG